jgi:hypothetical protein
MSNYIATAKMKKVEEEGWTNFKTEMYDGETNPKSGSLCHRTFFSLEIAPRFLLDFLHFAVVSSLDISDDETRQPSLSEASNHHLPHLPDLVAHVARHQCQS